MPIISSFYGIKIYMYFRQSEHEPSHIHAVYGEYSGAFELKNLKMIEGDLPKNARKLVKKWLQNHKDELQQMWETQQFKEIPPLL